MKWVTVMLGSQPSSFPYKPSFSHVRWCKCLGLGQLAACIVFINSSVGGGGGSVKQQFRKRHHLKVRIAYLLISLGKKHEAAAC